MFFLMLRTTLTFYISFRSFMEAIFSQNLAIRPKLCNFISIKLFIILLSYFLKILFTMQLWPFSFLLSLFFCTAFFSWLLSLNVSQSHSILLDFLKVCSFHRPVNPVDLLRSVFSTSLTYALILSLFLYFLVLVLLFPLLKLKTWLINF